VIKSDWLKLVDVDIGSDIEDNMSEVVVSMKLVTYVEIVAECSVLVVNVGTIVEVKSIKASSVEEVVIWFIEDIVSRFVVLVAVKEDSILLPDNWLTKLVMPVASDESNVVARDCVLDPVVWSADDWLFSSKEEELLRVEGVSTIELWVDVEYRAKLSVLAKLVELSIISVTIDDVRRSGLDEAMDLTVSEAVVTGVSVVNVWIWVSVSGIEVDAPSLIKDRLVGDLIPVASKEVDSSTVCDWVSVASKESEPSTVLNGEDVCVGEI
jgi:hypothetical protein